MEYLQSDLKYHSFSIISSHFDTVAKTPNDTCNYSDLKLEIDFEIFDSNKDEGVFKIDLMVKGNDIDHPIPGYRFFIVASGIFELKSVEPRGEELLNQFLLYSALPMMISSVRMYIVNVSSYLPHGPFMLPSIDLGKIIEQKNSTAGN